MPVPTVIVLQHVQPETPGLIADALKSAGVALSTIHSAEGQPVPRQMDDAVGLVVMGGPMGVYEQVRYPFLRDELHLIERALRAEKPVLGVCLGSQLLAAALGTPVTPGKHKEIGWHRVTLTDAAATDPLWANVESSFMAYHWHGDVFDLPAGATPLASSKLTKCQAYRYGRAAYGVLFHMEVTDSIMRGMISAFADELRAANIDQQHIVDKAKHYLPALQTIGGLVFRRWAGLVQS
jgi:GMP synthase (glutamine-hydrolysing)